MVFAHSGKHNQIASKTQSADRSRNPTCQDQSVLLEQTLGLDQRRLIKVMQTTQAQKHHQLLRDRSSGLPDSGQSLSLSQILFITFMDRIFDDAEDSESEPVSAVAEDVLLIRA